MASYSRHIEPDSVPPLARLRRAALLMTLIGGFFCALGLCGFTSAMFGDESKLQEGMQKQREMMRNYLHERGENENEPLPGFISNPNALRHLAAIAGILILACGVGLIAIGQSIRSRSRPAIFVGIGATGFLLAITLLMSAMMTLSALIVPPIFACVCASVLPIGLLVMQLIALVSAVRSNEWIQVLRVREAEQTMQSRIAAATFGMADYRTPPPIKPESPKADA